MFSLFGIKEIIQGNMVRTENLEIIRHRKKIKVTCYFITNKR